MSSLIESDAANQNFSNARNPDASLHVTFYKKTLQNNFETEKQGHPIFYDQDWVRIMIPGRNDLTIDEPMIAGHHDVRFPMQWARYKNSVSEAEQVVGTPVTEWPAITRAQAEELKGKRFYTVEQIAECSDAQIAALGMNANHLRLKARAFLENAKGSALAQHQAAELARKDQVIADLQEGQKRLSEQMQAILAGQPKKNKGGRPRKQPQDTVVGAAA